MDAKLMEHSVGRPRRFDLSVTVPLKPLKRELSSSEESSASTDCDFDASSCYLPLSEEEEANAGRITKALEGVFALLESTLLPFDLKTIHAPKPVVTLQLGSAAMERRRLRAKGVH